MGNGRIDNRRTADLGPSYRWGVIGHVMVDVTYVRTIRPGIDRVDRVETWEEVVAPAPGIRQRHSRQTIGGNNGHRDRTDLRPVRPAKAEVAEQLDDYDPADYIQSAEEPQRLRRASAGKRWVEAETEDNGLRERFRFNRRHHKAA